ncbi:MAG: hypothetical protein HJJLKODD_02682 [Phycisphaerae bacterium]|nr:hypothetical protein [Phycisphaerae bacterium]
MNKTKKSDAVANVLKKMCTDLKAQKDQKRKKPKPQREERLSVLDAAAKVLEKAGKPMRCAELIKAMTEQDLWTSPKGKTPHATLYAAMMREERVKGEASRFKKVDRGQFEYHAPKSA